MYYKVVRKSKDGLRSACTGPKHSVKYIPGEWATPILEGSKLYVFEDLKDAIIFQTEESDDIWECEVEDVTPFKACVFSDIKIFWKEYNSGLPISWEYTKGFPSAKLASRVKLTKCVKACST